MYPVPYRYRVPYTGIQGLTGGAMFSTEYQQTGAHSEGPTKNILEIMTWGKLQRTTNSQLKKKRQLRPYSC